MLPDSTRGKNQPCPSWLQLPDQDSCFSYIFSLILFYLQNKSILEKWKLDHEITCLKCFNRISHFLRIKFKLFIFLPWPKRPPKIWLLPAVPGHASLSLALCTLVILASWSCKIQSSLPFPFVLLFLYLECSSYKYSHLVHFSSSDISSWGRFHWLTKVAFPIPL